MPPRKTSSSNPRMWVFTRARAIDASSRTHGPRDPEAAVVEDHRQVTGLVARAAHLHDPQPSLRVQVGDHVHPQMDHAGGEEVLVPATLEYVARDDPVGAFRDHEAREVLIPQPLEEPVHLPASVLEL